MRRESEWYKLQWVESKRKRANEVRRERKTGFTKVQLQAGPGEIDMMIVTSSKKSRENEVKEKKIKNNKSGER